MTNKKGFKVRRNAMFMSSASFIGPGPTDLDEGLQTSSGSVSTFKGGLTAASSFLVTGCAIFGTGGTAVAGILAGSAALTVASYVSGCAVTMAVTVAGLTQSHKVFVSASDLPANITLGPVSCSPGGGVMLLGVKNTGSTTNAEGTHSITYMAFLDK